MVALKIIFMEDRFMQYDIGIIGGGPAGISAAITAASKGRKVVLFEAHGLSLIHISEPTRPY